MGYLYSNLGQGIGNVADNKACQCYNYRGRKQGIAPSCCPGEMSYVDLEALGDPGGNHGSSTSSFLRKREDAKYTRDQVAACAADEGVSSQVGWEALWRCKPYTSPGVGYITSEEKEKEKEREKEKAEERLSNIRWDGQKWVPILPPATPGVTQPTAAPGKSLLIGGILVLSILGIIGVVLLNR